MKQNQNIALGTAAIGRPQYINIKKKESEKFDKIKFKRKGMSVLNAAYAEGVRYFDTSPGYGMAEQILIDWLKTKNDKSIEVATKWGYSYVANFNPNATLHELKDHSLSQLLRQWEESKQLLPNLSTYQIHSATFDTGVLDNKEVLGKLGELKEIFSLKMGITTSGDDQVEVIKKALDVEVNNKQIFDTFQVTYNILDQCLLDILDILTDSKKRIIVKEALANGRLFRNEGFSNYSSLYDFLEALAGKYMVGVDAIALRFCVDTVYPFVVLSGASEEFQILENMKSNQIELEQNDIDKLKSFRVDSKVYWNERKQLNWN